MKTLFRLLLTLGLTGLALAPAHAQAVTNGGFETWAARSGVDSPTGWLTTDDVVLAAFGLPLPSGSFTKTTDVHGGTYALRLETKSTLVGALPGAVGTGTKVGRNIALPGGVPFTGRPAMLQFYYKLSGPQPPVAANGAFAQVLLTRTVNGTAQPVATAQQLITTLASSYVLVQVPLTYTSSAAPDSMRLAFSSGAIPSLTGVSTATVGTVLQIDDVSFTGVATASRSAALNAAVGVYPNPSPNGRYVLTAAPALLAAPLTVADATGRIVHREGASAQLAPSRTLDLTGLARGLYLVQLETAEGVLTKRVLVP
jgi:fluoride ion exporter CrcB/FEX